MTLRKEACKDFSFYFYCPNCRPLDGGENKIHSHPEIDICLFCEQKSLYTARCFPVHMEIAGHKFTPCLLAQECRHCGGFVIRRLKTDVSCEGDMKPYEYNDWRIYQPMDHKCINSESVDLWRKIQERGKILWL